MSKPTWIEKTTAALAPEEQAKFIDHLRYDALYADIVTQMRILLSAKGVSQTELAKRMGTSESAISRLLNDAQVRNIKLETLVRFAKVLDVGLQDSLFDDPVLAPALTRKRVVTQAVAVQQGRVAWLDGDGADDQWSALAELLNLESAAPIAKTAGSPARRSPATSGGKRRSAYQAPAASA